MSERLHPARRILGLVSAAVMAFLIYDLAEPLRYMVSSGFRHLAIMGWVLLIGGFAGWGWLCIACLSRLHGIDGKTLALVVCIAVIGMGATLPSVRPTAEEPASVIVLLTGVWMFNGLAGVWLWQIVRRMLRESNRED